MPRIPLLMRVAEKINSWIKTLVQHFENLGTFALTRRKNANGETWILETIQVMISL